jgi:hypothetical protein
MNCLCCVLANYFVYFFIQHYHRVTEKPYQTILLARALNVTSGHNLPLHTTRHDTTQASPLEQRYGEGSHLATPRPPTAEASTCMPSRAQKSVPTTRMHWKKRMALSCPSCPAKFPPALLRSVHSLSFENTLVIAYSM